MEQFMACNELLVLDCIEELRQDPIRAQNFIQAVMSGVTVSYHGYQFTDYDTKRIYDSIKNERAY